MSESLVSVNVEQPDREMFDRASLHLTEAKSAWDIVKQEEADAMGGELVQIKTLQKQLEEKRTTITKPLNEALKRVNDLFRGPRDALDQAEALIKGKMLKWREALAKIARAEQARLDELARKEREALARRAEEAERKASEYKTQKAREDAMAKAAAFRNLAEQTVAPQVAVPVSRTVGQSVRESYTFEIEDAAKIPRDYLVPDLAKIGAMVRATKGTVPIPGIRIVKGETMSSRSA